MRSICAALGLLLLVGSLTGCGPVRRLVQPAQPEPEQELPILSPGDYRINIGDVLEFKFEETDQFNQTVTVRPDGRISLPYLGDVVAAGLTPNDLKRRVEEAYSVILRNPEVTVIVHIASNQAVFVVGEVNEPGLQIMQPNMTVLKAIAMAGSFRPSAKRQSVMLLRRQQNGQYRAYRLDLRAASVGRRPELNVPLEAGDIIYVPTTVIYDIENFMTRVYNSLIPPINAAIQALILYQVTTR
ncbi:MAG: polysaccharide export protein [Bacteroidetes bacterium]|nr:polysaccharide export protein [Rhodothermia bacterium]MCS7155419.1 polysaccharide export protein [Bacteroidota bacterium]MCX7907488.1 polysaccharide export protein [Bacteroidota bacterium]MDW8138482.1 polysaccharide biosynthesis/export family protein [Bacteroidota bacterium]MDW8284581.1 polysaccharide biosynthesis/export family protein [Bacteroidota bacterium]